LGAGPRGGYGQPGNVPASLAYRASSSENTNPEPFVLSPILNLPPSFGSAYVGETFSCTLCATHDVLQGSAPTGKHIRDVRIEAEMKSPAGADPTRLGLSPGDRARDGIDLKAGETLQRIVSFDLKEEGNHILAVTVSYYEATETSGRTRSFRKLYQFICKASLIVRTKVGVLPTPGGVAARRWVLEAQLENCSEDASMTPCVSGFLLSFASRPKPKLTLDSAVEMEMVGLDVSAGLAYQGCNWEECGNPRPVLQPGEIEQVCFVLAEQAGQAVEEQMDGKLVFGTMGIRWRNEMGSRGFLQTGKLGTRVAGR